MRNSPTPSTPKSTAALASRTEPILAPISTAMAVPGDRGPGAPKPRFPSVPHGRLPQRAARIGDEFRERMRPDAARHAIHGQQRALGQREDGLSQAGDIGDAKAAGQDRGVRGRPTQGRTHPRTR